MSLVKNIRYWLNEGQSTIGEDFGGDLTVKVDGFTFIVPAGFKYDRFTIVYDTPYRQFWKAAAFHDWGYENNFCLFIDGVCVVKRKMTIDWYFYKLMRGAIQEIKESLSKSGVGKKRVQRIVSGLETRAKLYYYGVVLFGRFPQVFRELANE
jgi:hypothetical protein